jgi:hypothetical protein
MAPHTAWERVPDFDVFVVGGVFDRELLFRQGYPGSVSVSRMAQWCSCRLEGVFGDHSIKVSVV